ncbi:MAG: 6-bladed beta-propeller [Bacteroidales bacterium]|nr:6-bladed beta-propeller [Bacteroidales bacterium]
MKTKLSILISSLIGFIALVALSGCKGKAPHEEEQETIGLDAWAEDSLTIVNPKIICLDYGDFRPLGNIDKILATDSLLFLQGMKDQKVVVFSQEGKALKEVARLGNGAGEYLNMYNFDIDSNGNVYVGDIMKRNIIKYLAPNYINFETYPMDCSFLSICVADSTLYIEDLLDQDNNTVKLAKVESKTGRITPVLNALYPEDYRIPNYTNGHFFKGTNDDIYFYNRFADQIYKINGAQVEEAYQLASQHFPTKEKIEQWLKEYPNISHPTGKSDEIRDISYFYDYGPYFLIGLQSFPPKYIAHDKETGLNYSLGKQIANPIPYMYPEALAVTRDGIISPIFANTEKQIQALEQDLGFLPQDPNSSVLILYSLSK